MALLEIACFNSDSAHIASAAGADRIELCAGADVGGTTPATATLSDIKASDHVKIPVFVMIRPRGGDFVYSEEEFIRMKASVEEHKSLADGFVFGILDRSHRIDLRRTSELVALAQPLPCTFHRAFDETIDLYKALEDVISCGLGTILTSGGESSAIEGCNQLQMLVSKAQGRIVIMPGGGVRSVNIKELQRRTNAAIYHSSALTDKPVANFDEVRQLKRLLNEAPRL